MHQMQTFGMSFLQIAFWAIISAMPIYHFTIHAYRSWHEDHPRGYVQRGESGLRLSNPALAAYRNRHAAQSELRFTPEQMSVLLDAIESTCQRKGWRPHGAAATCTHIHAVLAWDLPINEAKIQEQLKSGLGYCLSIAKGTSGNRWFSRGGEPTRVEDHTHLHYLLHDYLPKHTEEESGLFRLYGQDE